jgi:hypothetical protein
MRCTESRTLLQARDSAYNKLELLTGQLAAQDPQPTPGLHCQAPAGTLAARTLPRPSNSDWLGSGKHHQPGRTALGPPCWTRSSADPGLATARPRRALALHGPSRGPVTQTGPDPTRNIHFTQPPLTRRPSCYSPHHKCAAPHLSLQGGRA